tara:strand:- start:355 stop:732 length:378 start_codon:yes stop_codon:yes gene_type:complete
MSEVKTKLTFENYKRWLSSVTDSVTYRKRSTIDEMDKLSVSEKDSINDIIKRWDRENETHNPKTLCVTCRHCDATASMEVELQDFEKWLYYKMPIAEALPYLTSDDQNFIYRKTCGNCWDRLFQR